MLEADRTFKERWLFFLDDYADEDELPLYVALSELADHLVQRFKKGDTAGFIKVFEVVERWHTSGDRYVREAATIGLLEDLQNHLGGNGRKRKASSTQAMEFEVWLGPQSRRWWDKLDRYWDGDRDALMEDN